MTPRKPTDKKGRVDTSVRKDAMIQALTKSLGIVTTACKVVGIDSGTHYDWLKSDPEYRETVEAIKETVQDFAESQLHKQMQEGNVTAIIFFLKCKAKNRGYIEREMDNIDANIKVNRAAIDLGNGIVIEI
jgi:hypothetical protein